MESRNIPKHSLPSLDVKSNYYVVPIDGVYHYFPIKIEDASKDSQILRLAKFPPVLIEGIAIIARKFYEVTIHDLQRGIVRKSRELKLKGKKHDGRIGNSHSTSSMENLAEAGCVQSSDELGTNATSTLALDEAANTAWTEQVEALLHALSEEEGGEWEITDTSQP